MLGNRWRLFCKAVITWVQQGFRTAAVFPSPKTGSHTLRLLDDLPGLGWVTPCLTDRLKGHSVGQGPGAPGWGDEVPDLRARLGSTMLTQNASGSISDKSPVSQDVIPGGELGCHGETDNQLGLDSGGDEEETASFSYFFQHTFCETIRTLFEE